MHFAAAHDFYLFTVGVDAAREHLLYGQSVCALSSQVCRRLKGAHACFENKVFGVKHDSAEQRVRLNVAELRIVHVADDFGAHLRR